MNEIIKKNEAETGEKYNASATYVGVINCPALTEIPNFPSATDVRVINCPALTEIPNFPSATYVRVINCPALTEIPNFPSATYVYIENCPALTEIPNFPSAKDVRVINCPAITKSIQSGVIGSRNDVTTYWLPTDFVKCGSFGGSLDEFESAVIDVHGYKSKHGQDYLAYIEKCKEARANYKK